MKTYATQQTVTARGLLRSAVTAIRLFFIERHLAAVQRDLDLLREQRKATLAAEAYLQREAMFLRCDLKR